MTKTYSVLRWMFTACFALVLVLITMQNGWILALITTSVVAWLCSKTEDKLSRFTLWLFIGGFVLRVGILLILHPPLESDFLTLYRAAESLLTGDKSFADTAYFTLWAYQSVFVAWEALWLTLWHDPMCLRLVNAVLSAGIVCLLYRLLHGKVSEGAARTSCVLLTLFPFMLTLHTVLTNQIISLFFFVLGLWILVCTDCNKLKFWRYPLAGLIIQCGNLMRPEGMIILVVVLAWAVFKVLEDKNRWKKILCGVLALLVIYFAVGAASGAVVRMTRLNENGLVNGNPLWKFVTGLNPDTNGGYSADDWALIGPTLDEDHHITPETEQIEKELILSRLANSKGLLRLAILKIDRIWNADALYWAMRHTQNGSQLRAQLYDTAREFDRGLFGLVALLAFSGLLLRGRKKSLDVDAYLFYFVPFALSCALLLIEVQPRYVYLAQPFLFMCAAFGLDYIEEWKKGRLK